MADPRPTILTVHIAPPENTVKLWLQGNLPLTGLRTRNVDAPVINGHPLFVEGISESGFDRNFPRVGVEWTRDIREDYIGHNFRRFKPTDRFRAALHNYTSSLPRESRAAPEAAAEELGEADIVETWLHMVQSEVIIAGFTSGGAGRPTLRILYETVESLMAPMAQDIMEAFPGVKVDIDETHEVNITSNQFASPVWGFEIPIKLRQPRRVFRKKPAHLFPDITGFDIHMEDSRTVFKTRGLFDFDAGYSVVQGESNGQ
ncbi:MAG: hypothetical protein RH862_20440 [Leptospiraceae bacterium]